MFFFGIYSFDLIICYFTIFVFIYISGVSSICSEKNRIAFLVNLLTKSVFVYFKNLRFCSF